MDHPARRILRGVWLEHQFERYHRQAFDRAVNGHAVESNRRRAFRAGRAWEAAYCLGYSGRLNRPRSGHA